MSEYLPDSVSGGKECDPFFGVETGDGLETAPFVVIQGSRSGIDRFGEQVEHILEIFYTPVGIVQHSSHQAKTRLFKKEQQTKIVKKYRDELLIKSVIQFATVWLLS